MNHIIVASLLGLAAALILWGGQALILRRFRSDVQWVREMALRFRPTPAPAEQWTLLGYIGMIFLLVLLLSLTPHPLLAFFAWIIMLALPRKIVEMLWQSRRRKIDMQIPAAVAAMANSLRAGLTLVQAMQRLADNAPEPIRTDFRVLVNRYAIGANLEATIRQTKQRLQLANFNLFASALLINREMGGDIAETLQRISASLDKLQQMRKTVEAHTAEGRTNIKVLLAAPIFLLLMISTADSEGVSMLFNTVQGWAVLTTAGLLIGIGLYVSNLITHQEI